ncbi:MAG TPA: FAD-dependent oxidoreductase [Jatrophihabitans sp.]|nr:FAD-dependent oxidoreductase [Jatrophihabitans sp.]
MSGPPGSPPASRSTADPDVLVIGGGIAGLFSAYFLRQAGHAVTLVERTTVGDPLASSSGNTGFVGFGGLPLAEPGTLRNGLRSWLRPNDRLAVPPTFDPDRLRWLLQLRRAGGADEVRRVAAIMREMKRQSLEILAQLHTGIGSGSGLSSTGVLQVYRLPATFERACQAVPAAVAAGIGVRIISSDELRTLEPDCEFDIAGALHNESGGFLPAPEFTRALARLLAELGVQIVTDAEVRAVEVAGDAVTAVRTSAGDLRPAEVVLAAGAWSTALARTLGVRLALQPIRGYAVTVPRPADGPRGPVHLVNGTVAIRPAGNSLRFAGDLTLAGADRSIVQRRVDRLWQTVRAHLPAMTLTGSPQVWAGLRPCTPDSLPLLGRVPGWRNLTVATGYGHNGMGLAPAAGRLVAELLDGKPTSMDALPFRTDRFGGIARGRR